MKKRASTLAILLVGMAMPGSGIAGETEDRPAVAAICTFYQPFMHSDVIVSKFLLGFPTDEGVVKPSVRIASLYIDQGPEDSLGYQLAEIFNISVFSTIEEALTLGGEADELAVDGVLLIGEHGQYPENKYGQMMYPKTAWMMEILRVFEASGRAVPVFVDKQLSHNWHDAEWMVRRSRNLGFPLMAGSVMPLVWRNPADFKDQRGEVVEDAVVLFHGSIDRYAIHGFELLQSMIEGRKGGETGVRRVETISGENFHRAMEDGRIPRDMVDQALKEHLGPGLEERPIRDHARDPVAFLLEYNDGTRAALLQLGNYYQLKEYWTPRSHRWFYAARVGGEIRTCEIGYRPPREGRYDLGQPVPSFSYLGLNVQQMFLTGQVQYPVERTLLTTGLAEAAIHSHHEGRPIETPHLAIKYQPFEISPIRPSGPTPTGASIEEWPEDESLRPLFRWR